MKDDNSSSLVTVAMLTTYLSKENKDYLDLIKPFVLNCIPRVSEKIDIEKIMEKMKNDFGFEDLPCNVLYKVLNKLSKGKDSYLQAHNKEYFVLKPYDTSEFSSNRSEIQRSLDEVIIALTKFCSEVKKNVSITFSKEIFVNFLNTYGFTLIDGIGSIQTLTNNDHNNYLVARFIIDEKRKGSRLYECILEIVKGYFVYKAIYFFADEHKSTFESKLKKTEIFLDTRLILNLLGYNTEYDKRATNELLKLIISSGGQLRAFEHTLGEVAGILTKYARDPYSRATMHLEYFDLNNYDEIDVIRKRGTLRNDLASKNIIIVEADIDYSPTNHNIIDAVDLQHKLAINFESVYQKFPKTESLETDVRSIQSIGRIRGNSHNVCIESCKAIFVTQNCWLVQAVHESLENRLRSGEICYVIHEIDLTAMLWLRTFDKPNSIPALKLIENTYAALKPSQEVIEQFNIQIKKLQKEGTITDEEALLIRTQPTVRQRFADLSQNDPNRISSEMVIQIRDQYVSELTHLKDTQLKKVSDELAAEKTKKSNAISSAEEECTKKSEKFYLLLKKVVSILLVCAMVVSTCAIIYQFIFNIQGVKLGYVIISLFLSLVLEMIGLFDIIFGKRKRIDKFLLFHKRKKFDKLYLEEIKKINSYFE